jgi:predicted phage terminase large subunit-like protein
LNDTKQSLNNWNSIEAELIKLKLEIFRKTIIENKYVFHKPQILVNGRSPQTEALIQNYLEVLYGGACGGGKSDWLLMAALQYVNEPGYAAIIFRQSFSDLSLPGALIDRAHQWLDDTDARWDGQTHTWTFPSGAKLAFGYLENTGDETRYKSAEFQFIGFDQVEEIQEEQYKFLFSRARRLKSSHVPLRVWSTANPDGLPWVKQRFITEKDPDRIFVPAKLSDNQYIDQESYIKALSNLDPVHRQQLLEGDWEVTPGGKIFQRVWFTGGDGKHPCRLIELEDVPTDTPKFRVWDCAATAAEPGKDPDWTAGTLSTYKNGDLYIIDVAHFRKSPAGTKQTMQDTADKDGLTVTQVTEEEGGSSGKMVSDDFARTVFEGHAYKTVKPTGDKATRAGPFASAAERGNVYVVRAPWLNDWLDELCIFPTKGAHDDQVDTAAYSYFMHTSAPRAPKCRHA